MPIKKIVTNALDDNVVTTGKTVGAISNFLVPAGAIIMWSGVSVPNGWQLCDGSAEAIAAGAPNLTDKFVVGAGSTYSLDATGGSADATLPSHNHGSGTLSSTASSNITASTNALAGSSFGAASAWSAASAGITGSTTTEGASVTNANLPPYYALAFIMKLA
jgi:microcystin-dependent protein